jgi:hypothetical protein
MDIDKRVSSLRERFSEVELIGQRMAVVSLTNPMSGGVNAVEYHGYTGSSASGRPSAEAFAGTVAVREPEYLIFFCSDDAITHALPLNTLFLDTRRSKAKRNYVPGASLPNGTEM